MSMWGTTQTLNVLPQRIVWAFALLATLATPQLHARTGFQRPTEAQLTRMGLETIAPFSTPLDAGGLQAKRDGYLRLGAQDSPNQQCVVLVRVTDSIKACKHARCMGLLSWGGEQEPVNGQHALLSQACKSKPGEKATLLFHNHPNDTPEPDRLGSHIQALSKTRLDWAASNPSVSAGPWMQKVNGGRLQIEMDTELGSGYIQWHPTYGFKWLEPNPSVHTPEPMRLNFNYSPPSALQLANWGLASIPKTSQAEPQGGWPPARKGYMLLGPQQGPIHQCVSVVQVNNPALACQQLNCRGLSKSESAPVPAPKQLALLSQACDSPDTEKATLLLNDAGLQTKDGGAGFVWTQFLTDGQFVIVLPTEAEKVLELRWDPNTGYHSKP